MTSESQTLEVSKADAEFHLSDFRFNPNDVNQTLLFKKIGNKSCTVLHPRNIILSGVTLGIELKGDRNGFRTRSKKVKT